MEGDHFCLRDRSHLECEGEDEHVAPECVTIIGRAVRVERGEDRLPVRLKGLELRDLPFADDLPPAEEEDDD